jgi:hypothetical protein
MQISFSFEHRTLTLEKQASAQIAKVLPLPRT